MRPANVHESLASSDAARSRRVGWSFVASYAAAYLATSLVFIAPLLVTLALKVNALVGTDRGADSLSLVASVGSFVALVANPLFGRLSDRTTSRYGRRRPWLLIGLVGGTSGIVVVATADAVWQVLLGWCVAQLFFNALLAALVAVLPDQVPPEQRGTVAGVLGVCLPLASVGGTYVVNVFSGHELAMFLAPCVIGGFFIVVFALVLDDRRLEPTDRPAWSLRQLVSTYYVSPHRYPDFAWAFVSRFLFVLAYAFLVTYQAFYLLEHLGSTTAEVPHQIFLGTLVQAAVVVTAALVGGRLSDLTGRRKPFVVAASTVYGVALVVVAVAAGFDGYLVGMAIAGLGFGLYQAVDLALVADVLPETGDAAKDLGVLNIAGALPFSLAPALAPAILAVGAGSYRVLYVVAGLCAVLGAAAILPVRRVR
ncbi:MFS transporter [Nocardioides islandensis]|uniref:MFS transporter n=1 Tax=Nocardioides islandensis TaxID=433663 RepID=A0A930VGQ6_9ACTN|nr:MFS transporter [Nocardioides islandensis]MBF4764465.1 MFS transporter [Nocardioides islandensis]